MLVYTVLYTSESLHCNVYWCTMYCRLEQLYTALCTSAGVDCTVYYCKLFRILVHMFTSLFTSVHCTIYQQTALKLVQLLYTLTLSGKTPALALSDSVLLCILVLKLSFFFYLISQFHHAKKFVCSFEVYTALYKSVHCAGYQ